MTLLVNFFYQDLLEFFYQEDLPEYNLYISGYSLVSHNFCSKNS